MKNIFLSLTSLFCIVLSGCGNQQTFSLAPDGQSFKQSTSKANNKIDVLWVVDNSSSMIPSQQNILKNFSAFMTNFISKGLDYQMAVTTTDAYLAKFPNNDPSLSKFRDGATFTQPNMQVYDHHTGINLLVPGCVSDIIGTFVTNAFQGDQGSGDERAFASLKAALDDPQNPNLVRQGAYFAVIILSDEDDFSGNRIEGSWAPKQSGESESDYKKRFVDDHDYNSPTLDSVDSYVSYLDQLTHSTPTLRHYNVSAVTVADKDCLKTNISNGSTSSIIGNRYIDIANKTDGTVGSICDSNFAGTLNIIQERILELSSQFYLERPPLLSSILVTVNSKKVPIDSKNCWTYDKKANSIVFHGEELPPEGADISVHFDPTTIKGAVED